MKLENKLDNDKLENSLKIKDYLPEIFLYLPLIFPGYNPTNLSNRYYNYRDLEKSGKNNYLKKQ